MLKKASNFVLGRFGPLNVREKVRLGVLTPCGLAGRPFWASWPIRL